MKEEEVIQDYIDYLSKQKMYSNHTVSAYLNDINIFNKYVTNEDYSLFAVDTTVIRNFLENQLLDGISRRSLKRRLVSLHGFYSFMKEKNIIKINPFINITSPKTDRKLPDFLYEEEIKKLFDENLKREDPYMSRDQAIIELLFASGLRVSELCSIKLNNIQLKQRFIRVIGKGKKERIVPFSSSAQAAIDMYMKTLRMDLINKKNSKHDNHLFLNEYGNPLTSRGVQYILNSIESKLGLGMDLHPHKFRHTFATTMLDRGADLRTIQEILGHESLSTTQVYTHISSKKMKEDYSKYFPRSKKED